MQSCSTCTLWEYPHREGDRHLVNRIGECRRHAPTLAPLPTGEGWPGRERAWPKVRGDDWCGDYNERAPEPAALKWREAKLPLTDGLPPHDVRVHVRNGEREGVGYFDHYAQRWVWIEETKPTETLEWAHIETFP